MFEILFKTVFFLLFSPNGATARALLKAGLDPEDGLRIVTINGVAPAGPITPAACIAEMAKSPVAEFGPSS